MSRTALDLPADLSRFVRFWYLHEFLHGFVLLYPVYAIFMLDQGPSAPELSWLFIIWSKSAMAFELPTGVLADRFSRRGRLQSRILGVDPDLSGCSASRIDRVPSGPCHLPISASNPDVFHLPD